MSDQVGFLRAGDGKVVFDLGNQFFTTVFIALQGTDVAFVHIRTVVAHVIGDTVEVIDTGNVIERDDAAHQNDGVAGVGVVCVFSEPGPGMGLAGA